MAVNMYFSLLVKVFKEEKSFSRVEDATIVQLDKIASEGEATTEFKDLFLAKYFSLEFSFDNGLVWKANLKDQMKWLLKEELS